NYLENARVDRAKSDVKLIQGAVDAWWADSEHGGDYPQSLELLTQRIGTRKASFTPEQLIDPWGRPYIYEYKNRHPQTDRTRIYSHGPPGSPQMISNW